MAKQFKPETLCVQAGWTPKKGAPSLSKSPTNQEACHLLAGFIFESGTLINGEYTGLALLRSPSCLYAEGFRFKLLCHNAISFYSFLSINAFMDAKVEKIIVFLSTR